MLRYTVTTVGDPDRGLENHVATYNGVSQMQREIAVAQVVGILFVEGDIEVWAMQTGTEVEVAEIQRYYRDMYGDHPVWAALPVTVYHKAS